MTVQLGSNSSLGAEWTFAPPTTGSNVNTTTATTLATPTTTNVHAFITDMQIATATLGGATELAIRDGAGGTVIWRTTLATTAMPLMSINFQTPLRGSRGNLLEVVTLTAVTGGVYVNAQGFYANL